MMRWLLTMLLLFGLSGIVDAREIKVPNIEVIIKRVSDISGLPVAPPPKEIKEVPVKVIAKYTGKRRARGTYLCVTQRLLYAPGYEWVIPHELVHMLQCAVRQTPTSVKSERQAARVNRTYWRMWTDEWVAGWGN